MTADGCKSRRSLEFLTLLGSAGLAAISLTRPVAASDAATRGGLPQLRIAISDTVVTGVNLSDARAAMSVWMQEMMNTIELRMALPPQQDWVMPSAQVLDGIRTGSLEMFCITIQEYRKVASYVDTSHVIVDDYGGEQMLLVVREESGIAGLAELRGRSLILQEGPNTSLAEPWLAVSLWEEGLQSPHQFLGRINTNAKLSRVVLPVFFGQTDACVVSRRGLDTMTELNPQLARKLKVLRSSPQIEGSFFAWRRGASPNLRKQVIDRLLELKSCPATRQVLTLFQSPGFDARDASCLIPANALLDDYERHQAPSPGGKR